MKKLLWWILWGSLLLNKVSRILAKERLLHRCFPVSFTKYFRTLLLQDASGWLLLLNTLFCSLRWPQPQKKFPSTWVILNIFVTNTMNCLRTARCGGPRQTVSCDYVDLLLIEQVKLRFCKTSQISQKTFKMAFLFCKTVSSQAYNCYTKNDTITGVFLWIYLGEYIFRFYFFVSEKTKAATRDVLWKKEFLKISQISKKNTCVGVSF